MQTQPFKLSTAFLRRASTAVATALLVGCASLTSARAQDCCAQVASPCEAYWKASAVFVGRVESIKRVGTTRLVSFSVLDGLRGVTASTFEVSTEPAGHRCSLSFRIGHEYIVYAARTEGGGFTTNRCLRSRDIEDAAADLAYARDVKQGSAGVGQITGRVMVVPRDLTGKATGPPLPLPDIPVTVARDGVAERIATDRAGDFRVENRGPGTYRVSVTVPERLYSDAPSSLVTLGDQRSCAHLVQTVHDNGQITGRVIDTSGRPVAGLTIELDPASFLSMTADSWRRRVAVRRTVTDRGGRYTLGRIPAGRFVLSLPPAPVRATGGGLLRVFYPGAELPSAAARVALAAGERRDLSDFRIPAGQKYVAVPGVVFDAGGAPAEGARVFLKGVGEGDRIVSEPVVADFMGRFIIAAREGFEYSIFAERAREAGRPSSVDSADEVTLTAAEGLKPVRLTLERRY
jgi:Carboxypeptidase regulatory-like domain